MRNLRTLMATLLIFFVAILGVWIKFLNTAIITTEPGYTYTVPSGATLKTVIHDLYQKDIIKNPTFLNLLARMRGAAHELKAGEYLFPKGTTPSTLLNQITTGSGLVYHGFTIVPGWNFKELSDALLKETHLRHTISSLKNDVLMARLGHPELNPEGQFFPDTYLFAGGTADIVVLKNAFKEMQDKLKAAWEKREPGLPYKNPYEALIAASLIEKEAYLNEERPIIAGVLVNRIRKDMLLQFDPTVIYGMGLRYVGIINKENLLEDSPYNTYIHKGLPPTPIAMPSLGSIMAVLHPEHNEYFYFVARGDGSHQFSRTLIEHNSAVTELRKRLSWEINLSPPTINSWSREIQNTVIPAKAGIHSEWIPAFAGMTEWVKLSFRNSY